MPRRLHERQESVCNLKSRDRRHFPDRGDKGDACTSTGTLRRKRDRGDDGNLLGPPAALPAGVVFQLVDGILPNP